MFIIGTFILDYLGRYFGILSCFERECILVDGRNGKSVEAVKRQISLLKAYLHVLNLISIYIFKNILQECHSDS